MTITLPPELAERIRRRLGKGRYETELELVEHAVSLLDAEEEYLADVRAKIEVGVRELDAGLGAPLDLEDFLKRAHARIEASAANAK